VKDGPAYLAGIESPKGTSAPMTREVVKSINNIQIKNIDDYSAALQTLKINTNRRSLKQTRKFTE
jgi:S1-C subfamily serine protease